MKDFQRITLKVTHKTPLVMHRFGSAKRREIAEKQSKKAKKERAVRNPEAEYLDSIYTAVLNGSKKPVTVMPCIAFKQAAVRAGKPLEYPMTDLRVAFHVRGEQSSEFAVIEGEHRMREDVVRLQSGVSDLRYRAEFPEWSTTLVVDYDTALLSEEQLISIFQRSGNVGVGEMRPEKSGNTFGMYSVEKVG